MQTSLATRVQFLIAATLLLLAGPASAADYPVKVTAARVGLPPGGKAADRDEAGRAAHVAKFASWAPVYVDLELAAAVGEPAELLIEAADPDEITTTLVVPLNLAGAAGKVSAADLGAIGYVRPAGSEVTITVRAANGGKALSEPFRVQSLRPRDPLAYVVLALGGHATGFDLPKPTGGPLTADAGLRGGRVELAAITETAQLPDQWFGYDAADVVVLNTGPGADEFLRKLFGDAAGAAEKAKRAALAEWVRRGGRLVVAVGANAGLVAQLPALQELLPFAVNAAAPSRDPGTLVLYWGAREGGQASTLSGAMATKTGAFHVANLTAKPGRAARVLIPPPDRQTADSKEVVAAQSAYGAGKVTVIGFDLDRPPFTDFSMRAEFWDWVLREGGANRASGGDGKPRPGGSAPTEEEDRVAAAIRNHTDTFDGVPVVSFGWVALLIVLYILLIGPVEYYFLKRILGRLELTWITFPIIVLTVSLAAYFTAYSMKGRDLKVNKLDVVDIDPASGRIYGTTWVTVFSPRIDNYTIGLTPGEGWAGTEPARTAVSWVGSPRGGRASLLRRSYHYHSGPNGAADGLEKVPIQVWSTKSFVADWSAPLDPGAPVFESRLEHPPADRSTVVGTFVNRLPGQVVLSDCVAFYAGQAYPLPGGTIRSGETVRLVLDKGLPATQWLQNESQLKKGLLALAGASDERPGAKAVGSRPGAAAASAAGGAIPLLGLLFHEASLTYGEGVVPENASLRRLDQSWRLTPDNRGEVILVGRVAAPPGPAEETLSGPAAPSRLWLRGLPGSGEPRAPIPGTGRQETWVRVYLPVRQ
jgi:hypothetical protein